MKHTNLKTLLIFIMLITMSMTLIACKHYNREPILFIPTYPAGNKVPDMPEVYEESAPSLSIQNTVPSAAATPEPPQIPQKASMEDALLIGDSRTVGLRDYADIEGADFFAYEGMSVYTIDDVALTVPSVGKVSFEDLLQTKNYGKIYLMLGINEAGYDIEQTAGEYDALVARIQRLQPAARLYLQANLHVSESRSRQDSVYNNKTIDQINNNILETARKHGAFYLDINTVFDDASGNLRADITGDDTHPFSKYYAQWADWLQTQTASAGKENAV